MILLILLLLLQGKPAAPFQDPNYDPDDPKARLVYEGDLTPSDGNLSVTFDKEPFKRPPSCSFSGGTLPGEQPKISATGAKLKVKSGVKTHYKCEGLKKDTEEHGA